MMHRDARLTKPKTSAAAQRNGAACAPWTVLLPDAAEGLLSEVEQRALNQHLLVCPACAAELAEAQRGLVWLTVLKEDVPEPPADLLRNVLAQTTGLEEAGVALPEMIAVPATATPGYELHVRPTLLQWLRGEPGTWSSLLQPRLAMTGAMAFFSICLTLNLFGISVNQLDAETFRKGGLQRTVADTGASLVRSIQGLRVVYRVQSHVSEMRAEMDGPEQTQAGR